jgi:hypothetical protein
MANDVVQRGGVATRGLMMIELRFEWCDRRHFSPAVGRCPTRRRAAARRF